MQMDVILFSDSHRFLHQFDGLLPTGKFLVHIALLELLDTTRPNRREYFPGFRIRYRIDIAKPLLSANACCRMGFINLTSDYLPLASGTFPIICNRKPYHGAD